MLKYFFNLYFQYEITEKENEKRLSTFNLGYFSTRKKAKNKILYYKDKPGFNKFPLDCFKIQKFGVRFSESIKKEYVDLYELSYEFENKAGEDEWILFGVYSSMELAENEREKQQKKCKYSVDGFYIAKWKVDADFLWKEGFDR